MNDAEKQINPYSSPHASESNAGSTGFRFNFAFVMALLLTGVLPVAIFFSRGPALKFFDDFGIELPTLTCFAMSWTFLLLTCGLFLFTLVKEFVLPPVMSTRLINTLSSLTAIVLGILYAFFLGVAILGLIQNLA